MSNGLIRMMTRMSYDIQELRIATGLRVVAQFRSKFADVVAPTETLEIPVGATEEEIHALKIEAAEKEDKKRNKLLVQITASYERVTDGVAETSRRKHYKFDDIIQTEDEIMFIENYLDLLNDEKEAFLRLGKALKNVPFYVGYLLGVKGIGPAMAGVIISELDPHKAKYPSSFWKYAGLDVVPVFDKESHELIGTEGRGRKEGHLVESEYRAKDGTIKTKRGLSYNPWLKSKLLAVVASSFLRANNEKYVKVYQDYKFRQLNRPELAEKKAKNAIAHKRAIRYMIKQFLVDLHMAWREFEGLEVSLPYAEAKLGLTHGRDPSAESVAPIVDVVSAEELVPEVKVLKKRGRPAKIKPEPNPI